MAWRFGKKSKAAYEPRRARIPVAPQKPSSFQYSSNRLASERGYDRGAAERELAHSQKIKLQLRRIPYAVGLICLFIGAGYLSTLSTTPQVVVAGQQAIRDKAEYRKAAEELLKAKAANRSKISFDGQQLAERLQERFPELSFVDVSTPLLRHKPIIELVISSPALVFISGNETYLVDERGIALFDIKHTDHYIDISKLHALSDQTSFNVEPGKPALGSYQVKFVQEIIRQTAAKGLKVASMELVSGGGQLDVRFKDLNYKVKFNFYEDGRKSAGAFLAAKEQIERDSAPPAEYIDVRISSRAYVR